jgi:hypothetical protein
VLAGVPGSGCDPLAGPTPIRLSSSVTVPSMLPRRLMEVPPTAASFCWAQGAGCGQDRSGWLRGLGLLQ